MKKQQVLTRMLDWAILITIVIAVGILAALPFLHGFYRSITAVLAAYPPPQDTLLQYFSSLRLPPFAAVLAAVYFSGILYLFIAFDSRRLTRGILYATPFSMGNVKALRRIAVMAFVECLTFALVTLGQLLLGYSIFTLAITLIIAIASAFVSIIGAVLAQLLRSAIKMKQENDLTI